MTLYVQLNDKLIKTTEIAIRGGLDQDLPSDHQIITRGQSMKPVDENTVPDAIIKCDHLTGSSPTGEGNERIYHVNGDITVEVLSQKAKEL